MPATTRSTRVDLSIRILFNYACYILRSSLLYTWNYNIFSRRITHSREEVACKVEGLELGARISAFARSAGTPRGHYATCPRTNPRPTFLFLLLLTSHFVSRNVLCSPKPLLQFLLDIFLLPVLSLWSYWFTLATLSRLLTRLLNVRQMSLGMCTEKQNRVNIQRCDTVKYGSYLKFPTSPSASFYLHLCLQTPVAMDMLMQTTRRSCKPTHLFNL
jgi:hypothetical protein